MIERKLTNKDMIRVRQKAMLRGLAIADEHERTHTGTAVNRRINGEEGHPQMPTPTQAPEERTQMILQILLTAGTESLPIGIACSRVALRYGLAHNQVPALMDEVQMYLQKVSKEVAADDRND